LLSEDGAPEDPIDFFLGPGRMSCLNLLLPPVVARVTSTAIYPAPGILQDPGNGKFSGTLERALSRSLHFSPVMLARRAYKRRQVVEAICGNASPVTASIRYDYI
jgi:hypothetical protein